MATTIRELITVLGVQADTRKVAEFDLALDKVSNAAKGAAKFVAVLAGATAAATAAIAGVVSSTMAAGDAIDKGSQRTATSAREYQVLAKAADMGGASLEQLEGGLKFLNKEMAAAKAAGQDYIDVVDGIRVPLRNANGEALTQAQLLARIADEVQGATSAQEKLTIASAAFGEEAGARLVPMLDAGSEGLRNIEERAEALGQIMSDRLVKGSAKLTDQLGEVKGIFTGLRNTIAERVIPVVNDLLTRFLDWYEVGGDLIRQRLDVWAERIARGVELIGEVAAATDKVVQSTIGSWEPLFLALGVAVAAVGAGLTVFAGAKVLLAVESALSAVGVVVGSLATALGITFGSTLVLVIGLIAGIIVVGSTLLLLLEDLYSYFTGADSAIGTFIDKNLEAQGALGGLARWLQANMDQLRAFADVLKAVDEWLQATFGASVTTAVTALSTALQTLWLWLQKIADSAIGSIFGARAESLEGQTSWLKGVAARIRGSASGDSAAVAPGPGSSSTSNSTSNSIQNQVQINVGPDADVAEVQAAVDAAMEEANRRAIAAMGGSET